MYSDVAFSPLICVASLKEELVGRFEWKDLVDEQIVVPENIIKIAGHVGGFLAVRTVGWLDRMLQAFLVQRHGRFHNRSVGGPLGKVEGYLLQARIISISLCTKQSSARFYYWLILQLHTYSQGTPKT